MVMFAFGRIPWPARTADPEWLCMHWLAFSADTLMRGAQALQAQTRQVGTEGGLSKRSQNAMSSIPPFENRMPHVRIWPKTQGIPQGIHKTPSFPSTWRDTAASAEGRPSCGHCPSRGGWTRINLLSSRHSCLDSKTVEDGWPQDGSPETRPVCHVAHASGQKPHAGHGVVHPPRQDSFAMSLVPRFKTRVLSMSSIPQDKTRSSCRSCLDADSRNGMLRMASSLPKDKTRSSCRSSRFGQMNLVSCVHLSAKATTSCPIPPRAPAQKPHCQSHQSPPQTRRRRLHLAPLDILPNHHAFTPLHLAQLRQFAHLDLTIFPLPPSPFHRQQR